VFCRKSAEGVEKVRHRIWMVQKNAENCRFRCRCAMRGKQVGRPPHPGGFAARVWKLMKRQEIDVLEMQKSAEDYESKGDSGRRGTLRGAVQS
jgi:hypothetical protein